MTTADDKIGIEGSATANAEQRERALSSIVFAESLSAVEWATNNNVIGDNFELVSSSPYLQLAGHAEELDEPDVVHRLSRLNQTNVEFTWAVFTTCQKAGLSNTEALCAAHTALTDLGGNLYRVAPLTDLDLTSKLVALTPDLDGSDLRLRFSPAITSIDATALQLKQVLVPGDTLDLHNDVLPPVADFQTRLMFASKASLGYRALQKLWSLIRIPAPKGTFLVYRESELVKETAFSLALSGYSIAKLQTPNIVATPLRPAVQSLPEVELSDLFEEYFGEQLDHLLCQALTTTFLRGLRNSLSQYLAWIDAWRAQLDRVSHLKPRGILTNPNGGPPSLALFAASNDANLPVYSFHHGIAMEFSQSEVSYFARHENTCADLSFCFSEVASAQLDQSPYPHCATIAVGLPKEYFGVSKTPEHPKLADICYASTALYCANFPPALAIHSPDVAMARLEIRLIDEVLEALPHDVLYKPYPAMRYLDVDPVVARARASAKIKVYEDGLDLRYVARRTRVLVTSRATSTFVWCLLSGRPTIFIDVADQLPLRPQTLQELKDAAFVFETSEPNCMASLHDLLQQPLEQIERQYLDKATARAKFIKRFLSANESGAGKRAARTILDQTVSRAHTTSQPYDELTTGRRS